MRTNDNVQNLINLIDGSPEMFKHLQVFLHSERGTKSRPDNYYLMVSPRVFGKIEVLDLRVEGNFINIEFLDCKMEEVGNIRINKDDDKPSVLFICWQDIKRMVLDESANKISNDGLLDFFDFGIESD